MTTGNYRLVSPNPNDNPGYKKKEKKEEEEKEKENKRIFLRIFFSNSLS